MEYTKENFRILWAMEKCPVTWDDIADCAKGWGVCERPRCMQMERVRYKVLKAAGCPDAEEWNPDTLDDDDIDNTNNMSIEEIKKERQKAMELEKVCIEGCRHLISRYLMDTSEEKPLECDICCIGECLPDVCTEFLSKRKE